MLQIIKNISKNTLSKIFKKYINLYSLYMKIILSPRLICQIH